MIEAGTNIFVGNDPKLERTQTPQEVGTIIEVGEDGRVRMNTPMLGDSAKYYRCLSSYSPAVGDRVFAVQISGTYLVLGRIG